jgi:hypothetical protein
VKESSFPPLLAPFGKEIEPRELHGSFRQEKHSVPSALAGHRRGLVLVRKEQRDFVAARKVEGIAGSGNWLIAQTDRIIEIRQQALHWRPFRHSLFSH